MSLFTTSDTKVEITGSSAIDKARGFVTSMTEKNKALNSVLATSALPTEVYFPPEMIGGCCPLIEGQEQQMAWQAAAEALDSERLHLVWRAADGMVWFLAVKSSDLSSHSNSWCPLAALLPGMENAQPLPVLYLHEFEGLTTLMTLADGELSIHRGASMIIQAKAERIARDHGNAPIYNLLPEQIDQLTPVPWHSVSLLEDKARRFMAISSVLAGLGVAVVAFIMWLLASFASLSMKHDVTAAQEQSAVMVQDLMRKAVELRASPLHNQIGRFAELNDELIRMGGWLKQYQIINNRVEWTAVLPVGITADMVARLGGRTKEVTDEGMVVVGN